MQKQQSSSKKVVTTQVKKTTNNKPSPPKQTPKIQKNKKDPKAEKERLKAEKEKAIEHEKKVHDRWMLSIANKLNDNNTNSGDPAREHIKTTSSYEWTHILEKDNTVTQSEYAKALAAKTHTSKPCGYLVCLNVTGNDFAVGTVGSDIIIRPTPKDSQVIQITSGTVECHADNYPLKVSTSVPVLENITAHQHAKSVGYECKQLFATSAPNNSGRMSFGHLLESKHHRSVISLPAGEDVHLRETELKYLVVSVYSARSSATGMSTEKEAGVLTGRITCRNLEFPPIEPAPGFARITQPEFIIIPTRSPEIVEGTIGLGKVDQVAMPAGFTVSLVTSNPAGNYNAFLPMEGLSTNPSHDVIYALDKPIAVNCSATANGVAQEESMTYARLCQMSGKLAIDNVPRTYLFSSLAKAKAKEFPVGFLSTTIKEFGVSNKLIPLFSMSSYYHRDNVTETFDDSVNRATHGKKPHDYSVRMTTVAAGDLATYPIKGPGEQRPFYSVAGIIENNPSVGVPNIKARPKE